MGVSEASVASEGALGDDVRGVSIGESSFNVLSTRCTRWAHHYGCNVAGQVPADCAESNGRSQDASIRFGPSPIGRQLPDASPSAAFSPATSERTKTDRRFRLSEAANFSKRPAGIEPP